MRKKDPARRLPEWRFENQFQILAEGSGLRIVVEAPADCVLTVNDWESFKTASMRPYRHGGYELTLPKRTLDTADTVEFTFFWTEVNAWEGQNFRIEVKR